MFAIMSSNALTPYSSATLTALGDALLALSRFTCHERLAAIFWSASRGAALIFSILLSGGLNGCLPFCIVGAGWVLGNGREADDNSSSAPLAGRENSISERRAGREALTGRPDFCWSIFK